jgi:flagella synthesis protein FlgN
MHDLSSVIRAELEAAKSFFSLLKDENTALAEGNSERISQVTQAKSEHLKKIADITQMRNQLLPLSEIPAWLDSHPELSDAWHDLKQLAEQIHQLNELNGKMIDVRLRSTQQALAVLHSLSKTATNLYGPDGQASFGMPSSRHPIENA